MKAGLITFHYAHHYGAQLQAYALMKSVSKAGADCEIIHYIRADTIEGSGLFKKGMSAGSLLSNANTLINYGKLKKRHDRFDSFVNHEMKLSERFYGSYEELRREPPSYDVYVCGSDQIWNPLIYREQTFDPAFFAEFAAQGKKIAYAPSFGITTIPEDKREELKKYLAKFEALSVREKQGEKIIREISGRDAVTVLDPTLLLTGDEWSELASEPAYSQPYLLCYFITDGRKYSEYVKALSEQYHLPVVSLCGSRRVVPQTKHKVLDAGPEEFISLFRHAGLVCTDSFHGTVFSVNFKKDFYSFESAQKSEKSVNSRLYNILDKLDLVSRLYSVSNGISEFKSKLSDKLGIIDYVAVDQLLQQERVFSCRYLKEALGV